MIPLQFLHSFVEIDDAIEEGKDVATEGGHVLHRPVMGIEDGQEEEHPGAMNERPSHERQEVNLSCVNTYISTCTETCVP